MKETLKKLMAGGAAVALLMAAQPLQAQCNPPSDPCSPCGSWEVGAHALYWTPIVCPYTFVVSNPPLVAGQRSIGQASTIKCSGDWGFRVFGRYATDCSFIGVGYQWYESTDSSAREGTFLRVQGVPAPAATLTRVTGRQRTQYQNVDVHWGRYLHRACGASFYLYGNARWVDLSITQSVSQEGANAQQQFFVGGASHKSSLQGGALGVGAGASFDLMCNVALFGDFNLLGIVADRGAKDVGGTLRENGVLLSASRLSYPSETCVIPEMDMRLGINYKWTCGCWTLVGELGYEIDYIWDAATLPKLTVNQLQNSNDDWVLQCQDVGFSGLFFGGRLLF